MIYIVKSAAYKGYKEGEQIPKEKVDEIDVKNGLIEAVETKDKNKPTKDEELAKCKQEAQEALKAKDEELAKCKRELEKLKKAANKAK